MTIVTVIHSVPKVSVYFSTTAVNRRLVRVPHTRQRVRQVLEYRIDVCRVTRGAHIENF